MAVEVDHCTGFWEGSWAECCSRHDRRYERCDLTRLEADILLYRCVKRRSIFIAGIMFIGVRFGGYWNYERINNENK